MKLDTQKFNQKLIKFKELAGIEGDVQDSTEDQKLYYKSLIKEYLTLLADSVYLIKIINETTDDERINEYYDQAQNI